MKLVKEVYRRFSLIDMLTDENENDPDNERKKWTKDFSLKRKWNINESINTKSQIRKRKTNNSNKDRGYNVTVLLFIKRANDEAKKDLEECVTS